MPDLWSTDTIRTGLEDIVRLAESLRVRRPGFSFGDALAQTARRAMMKDQGLRSGEDLSPGDVRDQVTAHLVALERLLTSQLHDLEADRCQGKCRI